MHVAYSPNFYKIYKFLPYFRKIYKYPPPNFVKFTYFAELAFLLLLLFTPHALHILDVPGVWVSSFILPPPSDVYTFLLVTIALHGIHSRFLIHLFSNA